MNAGYGEERGLYLVVGFGLFEGWTYHVGFFLSFISLIPLHKYPMLPYALPHSSFLFFFALRGLATRHCILLFPFTKVFL